MGEVVLEFADRRLVLRDLLVIGAQLRLELAFALHIIRPLQGRVGSLRRGCQRRVEDAMRQLSLGPRDLRFEAGGLADRQPRSANLAGRGWARAPQPAPAYRGG